STGRQVRVMRAAFVGWRAPIGIKPFQFATEADALRRQQARGREIDLKFSVAGRNDDVDAGGPSLLICGDALDQNGERVCEEGTMRIDADGSLYARKPKIARGRAATRQTEAAVHLRGLQTAGGAIRQDREGTWMTVGDPVQLFEWNGENSGRAAEPGFPLAVFHDLKNRIAGEPVTGGDARRLSTANAKQAAAARADPEAAASVLV